MTDYNKDLVDIHGKKYQPVASRLRMAIDGDKDIIERLKTSVLQSCETEILYNNEQYLGVKVRIVIKNEHGGGIFDGVAESDRKAKSIEGDSALEVAETSALGRALMKAGILLDLSAEGLPSSDEMKNGLAKTQARRPQAAPGRQQTNEEKIFGTGDQVQQQEETTETYSDGTPKIYCVDCKTALGKFTDADGKVYTPQMLFVSREKRYGRVLCTVCVRKIRDLAIAHVATGR